MSEEQFTLTGREKAVLDQIRVNAPARQLLNGMLEKFTGLSIHPEVGLDGRVLDANPKSVLKDLAAQILQAGLRPTVHGPFLDLSAGALDPQVLVLTRNRLSQALEAAAWFEPEHIVFHPDFRELQHGYYYKDWIDISLDTWRPLAVRCRELGIRMVFENTHDWTPNALVGLLDGLSGEGVGFCFDIGHSSAFGRVPMLEWLDTLGNHLQALHLHDNHGEKDDHLAIGLGQIDFELFFNWLTDNNVRPDAVTIEPHKEKQLATAIRALAGFWPWEVVTE